MNDRCQDSDDEIHQFEMTEDFVTNERGVMRSIKRCVHCGAERDAPFDVRTFEHVAADLGRP